MKKSLISIAVAALLCFGGMADTIAFETEELEYESAEEVGLETAEEYVIPNTDDDYQIEPVGDTESITADEIAEESEEASSAETNDSIPFESLSYQNECSHSLIHTDSVSAACETDGIMEYWACNTCGKYFADSDGKNEIEDIECWKTGEGLIPAAGHSIETYVKGNSAACTSEGNKEYWICSKCNEYFSDKNSNNKITDSIIIPAKGHLYLLGKCNECGVINDGFAYVNNRWGYYENGQLIAVTGLVWGSRGGNSEYYYVENGVMKAYNGIAQMAFGYDGSWYYVENGIKTSKSGLAQEIGGAPDYWYYVNENGVYEKDKNGQASKLNFGNNDSHIVRDGKMCD